MDLMLQGKKALVLASSKGIGKGVAEALAQEGCTVLISSSDKNRLQAAKSEIEMKAKAPVHAYVIDLYSTDSIEKGIASILKDHGGVDILVTNSPGPGITDAAKMDPELFKKALQANLLSAMTFCQKLIPGMTEKKFGRIINLASTTAKEPDNGMVLSNTMRAGLMAYCKTLSREIAQHGITVNTILTGGVMTDRTIELRKVRSQKTGISYEELTAKASQNYPVGFIPNPDEFVPMITFLASPLSKNVNGVSLPIDGGYMRGM